MLTIMLDVVMLTIMLNVVMLTIMLNVVMLTIMLKEGERDVDYGCRVSWRLLNKLDC